MAQLTEWLMQLKEGDDTAFIELYTHFEADLRRFMFRLVGQHEQSDDLIQNTFVAFYRNAKRLEPEAVRPFLFRVLRNQCYDELRRQGRYQKISLSQAPELMNTGPSPDEVTHWRMLYADVQTAMNQLPETQRQVLILYAEHGFSYQEIAETLTVNIGTVKSRLYHAKQNLRRLVDLQILLELDES